MDDVNVAQYLLPHSPRNVSCMLFRDSEIKNVLIFRFFSNTSEVYYIRVLINYFCVMLYSLVVFVR